MSPVTTESSQPAPPAPEAPQSAPAASSSSGNQNQQLRIGILVVIAVIVGVGLWFALSKDNSKKHKNGKGNGHPVALVKNVGPLLQSPTEVAARSLTYLQPIYWAGPKKNTVYEFWRVPNKNIFVRYLPSGSKAGRNGKHWTIIGTYPYPDAYHRLKKKFPGGIVGNDGSYIYQPPDNKTSVYMAWPKKPFEVEVYNPSPQKAATIAASGQVQPIAG